MSAEAAGAQAQGEPTQSEPTWAELKVGLEVGPLTYTVTREMVQAFCDAMPIEPDAYRRALRAQPTSCRRRCLRRTTCRCCRDASRWALG